MAIYVSPRWGYEFVCWTGFATPSETFPIQFRLKRYGASCKQTGSGKKLSETLRSQLQTGSGKKLSETLRSQLQTGSGKNPKS